MKIEFNSSNDDDRSPNRDPWVPGKTGAYQDKILKPEYEALRLRFGDGITWVRVVPALRESIHGWMLPTRTVEFPGGKCTHPRTLRSGTQSAFDAAYGWYAANRPQELFSKTNKTGIRLLTNPWGICWCAVEEAGRYVLRIFSASAYNGGRGGNPGLGYALWCSSRDRDETGELMRSLSDPSEGVLVGIEKVRPHGAKFPRYDLNFGRHALPMGDIFSKMDPDEQGKLCPLEQTIRLLTQEEQWQCVEKIVGVETVALIRKDLGL